MPPNTLIPKIRPLTPVESQSSFDSWREGMIWQISLDPMSARFLTDLKKWDNSEHRGFTNDAAGFDKDTTMTAVAKEMLLNIVLGSIASNCPIISPKFIKNVATSLDEIWERIRSYYGFRKTGGRITEFFDFTLETNESREALYERMYTYLEDNLLTKDGSVEHEGSKSTKDEELTPTLLNILVVNWLRTIHPSLPHAVKQKFPTQLRSNTIFSIRSEISDAIPSILEEIEEKASISRIGKYSEDKFRNKSKKMSKSCCLCKSAGRYYEGHYLSQCPFLPDSDKHYFSKTREIFVESNDEFVNDFNPDSAANLRVVHSHVPTSRRIDIIPSPIIRVSVGNAESAMLLDSGAETSLITASHCRQFGVKITPTSRRAVLADNSTSMKIIGEARFPIKFGHHIFDFCGLVVERLDTPIIAGVPFLEKHDIYVRPSKKTAYISNCCSHKYLETESVHSNSNFDKPSISRVSSKTRSLQRESKNLTVPDEFINEEFLAREPTPNDPSNDSPEWLPCSTIQINNTLPEKYKISYSSHATLLEMQKAYPDLMQVRKYLSQGLTPPYNKTPKDILRYMNCVSLSEIPNDLIVVKEFVQFPKQNPRIIIPRNMAPRLINAMHFELNHPSVHQLQSAFTRSFFTLDMHKIVLDVVSNCHVCACLKMHHSTYNDNNKDIIQSNIPQRPTNVHEYRDTLQSFRPSTCQRKTSFRFKDYDFTADSSSYRSVDTTDEPYVLSRTFRRKKKNFI